MRHCMALLAAALTAACIGCSASPPECGDEKVRQALETIIKESGVELTSLGEIKTNSRSGRECACSVVARVSFMGEDLEYALDYAARLTDDNGLNVKILEEKLIEEKPSQG